MGCIPEGCSTRYSGYEPDSHAVSWLLTAVDSVISGFSSADPRVSRPSLRAYLFPDRTCAIHVAGGQYTHLHVPVVPVRRTA
ncbi:hypothetical protein BON98_23870 [Escherichia coli]|nr:hypothetical protein BON98_23870 [Escherichia coli]